MGIVIQAVGVLFNFQDLQALLPDLILIAGIVLLFLSDVSKTLSSSHSFRLSLLLAITLMAMIVVSVSPVTQTFLLETTPAIRLIRLILLGALLLFFIQTFVTSANEEPYLLYCVLGAAIGADLLILAKSWILIFIAMETLSICSYMLVANKLEKSATEASVKYLLIGIASSAIMLFGLSLWYGMQGNLNLAFTPSLPISVGILIWTFVISGLLFKIAAPPFHFWIPDAYQSSSNSVVFYLSIAPKVAGLFVLWKIYYAQLPYPSAEQLRMILAAISVMALVWGNLAALKQNNLKRMLAYSSVAHAGLFIGGFLAVSFISFDLILFYLCLYTFTLLSAMLLLDYFESRQLSVNVQLLKGLGKTMPLASALFVFVMIALTGLPPTALFYGKLFIFTGLLGAYSESGNLIYLILFASGIAGTLFSLFFYLKGPYYMFFKSSEENIPAKTGSARMVVAAFAAAVPVLIFFLNPDWLIKLLR